MRSDRPATSTGKDYSTNPPSVGSMTLLSTINEDKFRLGYFVQCQDTTALVVELDHPTNTGNPTYVVLDAAASKGARGGSVDMNGLPFSGRIRIYGTTGDQMAARAW